ncbi:hypothetical protein SPHINGO391_300039 [Sphingomonas aurantiaca]|uniref:Uncharacterized protein n=1 Tax=Sphingomonas aurantiaca TaxID=185949 RepID=A0A5E7XYY0_9SPHN|nr:hypothetical protein SPHINGO391_300039 [Sphingomonas aurantiaca]VXC99549.1 hypothetical protein SPHINGOT1_280023 [Sphingomonas sp. T1]
MVAALRTGQRGGKQHYNIHFISKGSIESQIAANPTSAVAAIRRPMARRGAASAAQASPAVQAVSRLRHHMIQATTSATPLSTRSGVRMLASSARLPASPAPTPIEASASGRTQQAAAAVTALKPNAPAIDATPQTGGASGAEGRLAAVSVIICSSTGPDC